MSTVVLSVLTRVHRPTYIYTIVNVISPLSFHVTFLTRLLNRSPYIVRKSDPLTSLSGAFLPIPSRATPIFLRTIRMTQVLISL